MFVRYHEEIFIAGHTDDIKRLKDIFDGLDRQKSSSIKKRYALYACVKKTKKLFIYISRNIFIVNQIFR